VEYDSNRARALFGRHDTIGIVFHGIIVKYEDAGKASLVISEPERQARGIGQFPRLALGL
jgi:hypothetical protein